ncbi:MFS transporter, ACS family, glucarate transporter [Propionivibrio dicarboxylicus]|uniref:MFS transporter, ACS family, glucarate transporter n=1 Tax=Propionivibrio dicarboxylicus TaxID=83767 RepID=A0A1G7Z444_9RHOO|nr:MFS transporter, ACS family, glucarate transporter [Propionivibrio dicarboxylicus]
MEATSAAIQTTNEKRTNVRWFILAVIFFIMIVNFADRSAVGIAGPAIAKDLKLTSVQMGYILSGFGWAYVLFQLPGGYFLDKFGSKAVYAFSIFTWSLFTLLQGFVGFVGVGIVVGTFFLLRFMVGACEAPSFPGNSRIVAAWFPGQERGTASAIFNSSQYAATVFCTPLMAWLTQTYGWQSVFFVMGGIGILYTPLWLKFIKSPREHKSVNAAELEYLEKGGALIDIDKAASSGSEKPKGPNLRVIGQLLSNRMMIGIYVAQYCVTSLTYFFLTWFPIYLVQGRGMTILKAGLVASVPAIAGFIGGILGGVVSDWILAKTGSLTWARKIPMVTGMLLSMGVAACNYTDSEVLVVTFMAMAFFGKGFGALGWALNSDTAPKQATGISGGVLNTCGNLGAITMPIAIGYLVDKAGSFESALFYVGAHGAVAIFCYLVIVGEIKRVELKE